MPSIQLQISSRPTSKMSKVPCHAHLTANFTDSSLDPAKELYKQEIYTFQLSVHLSDIAKPAPGLAALKNPTEFCSTPKVGENRARQAKIMMKRMRQPFLGCIIQSESANAVVSGQSNRGPVVASPSSRRSARRRRRNSCETEARPTAYPSHIASTQTELKPT